MPKYRAGHHRTSGYYGRFKDNGCRPEYKFKDTTIILSALGGDLIQIPATGGQLNLIKQGTKEQERIGRKCCIKSFNLKGRFIYKPGVNAEAATLLNMWLILDKQCNGTVATNTQVFEAGNSGAIAMRNLANQGRFRILKHWTWVFMPQAGVSGAHNNQIKVWDDFVKVNTEVEFDSTEGVITEVKSNNYFLMVASEGSGHDGTIDFLGVSRARFTG